MVLVKCPNGKEKFDVPKFLRVLLVKPKGRKGLGFAADVIPIGLEYIAASIEKEADYVHIIDMEFEKHPFQHFLTIFHCI